MEYVIVQAGGKGTRLGYITKNKPKALTPVENLPMIFHLFKKFPDKKYIIIADYKKDVLREYLECFSDVIYTVVDAVGQGTCAGIKNAINLIPSSEPFMLIWSDLILNNEYILPDEYNSEKPINSYVGISKTFTCRWSYKDETFIEESSKEYGVAGMFLFPNKSLIESVPENGEFVGWLQKQNMCFMQTDLSGTKEFGLLTEYNKLNVEKCRPFNDISFDGNICCKRPKDAQGQKLAKREISWYKYAVDNKLDNIPAVYSTEPLTIEYINGKNVYDCHLDHAAKIKLLERIISALKSFHENKSIQSDAFSLKEAYYKKTVDRIKKVEDLIPFSHERFITINGRKCRNIFFYKRDLEKKVQELKCNSFCFIHGDCTFSNIIIKSNSSPIFIDPRGYFGYTELFGDVRYDWAKLYYSLVGNYDRFNLKDFVLDIGKNDITLTISSNHWEDMEDDFFRLTGADRYEIKLLHAIIWLSLTTYAWEDYDSICAAFYNGLYYLEEVL